MKCFLFLFLFFNIIELLQSESVPPVVNSCGNPPDTGIPSKKEDCKDDDEPACKFVTIRKGGDDKKFCAIIHGKYNDDGVINEVKNLINANEVIVEGANFIMGTKPLLFFIFIILLF